MINNCFETFNALLQDPDLFIDRRISVITHINQVFDKDFVAIDQFKSYSNYITNLPMLHSHGYGFKITGLETYNQAIIDRCDDLFKVWGSRVNVHGYLGYDNGSSFERHKDDCNVWLYVIEGQKRVILDDSEVILNDNEGVLIPKGVYHRIVNTKTNVALSFGHV